MYFFQKITCPISTPGRLIFNLFYAPVNNFLAYFRDSLNLAEVKGFFLAGAWN
jgi:hypothetical protein